MKKLLKIKFIAVLAVFLSSIYACNAETDGDVTEIESKKQFDELIKGDTPVLIDFHAVWCKPCKVQGPIVAEIQSEMGDKIIVVKVDVDELPMIASRYQIRSIPTLMIFKDGKQLWKKVGLQQKQTLLTEVNKHIEN